ncbi:MAG: TlpA family protein disulfide reductase [Crocinitomicaceae bacterium]|nr:TlpA family protein disulfide reductase [Crocinitomicaceae bacterium]
MKKIIFLLPIASLMFFAFTQDDDKKGKKVPNVSIKDVDGNPINTGELSNDGNPIVISFWATWCKPCNLELDNIMDQYEDWQDETGVKLVAVSIDDQRNVNKVRPFVDAKGWEYDIWLDPNGDFKRALGVNNVPHTFLVDGNRNIVYSHNGYNPGDEDELYDHILEESAK